MSTIAPTTPRPNGRAALELRPIAMTRRYTRHAPGSVLIELGNTRVLCTASVEAGVPPFLAGRGVGWLTAEYSMMPGSTNPRKSRDRGTKVDGRTVEIQRLIGRSLRTVIALEAIGEHTVWIDCDVLDADGGTRTAAITGAFVAMVDALAHTLGAGTVTEVVRDSVAAVSVGMLGNEVRVDLEYAEDSRADVDMNLVMTGAGLLIEVQGTGERSAFSRSQMDAMMSAGEAALGFLTAAQRTTLGADWPFPST